MYQTMLKLTCQLKVIFTKMELANVPFNKHVLIVAGKNSKLTYLERFETLGEAD